MKLIKFFINQSKLMTILIIFVIVFGVYIFIFGQKEAFPSFIINQIYINTVYPGASTKTIEKQITYPIEKSIKSISGIDKIESVTREGISSIIVTIDSDYETKIMDIKNEIKNKLDEINLPEDSENPSIQTFDNNLIPVIRVLATGNIPENIIREASKKFENACLEIKGVSAAALSGYREEEIKIECLPENLEKFNVSINDVMQAVFSKNINIPGGEVYKDNKTYLLRIREKDFSIENIKNIIIRANYDLQNIKIRDVANVYRGYKKADILYRANRKKGIEISIKKSKSGDTLKIAKGVKKLTEDFKIKYPEMDFIIYSDTSIFVKNRLNVLGNNAFIGLIFVIITLFLFFDFRTSFWTVAGMPVSFCAAMIISNFMGISLNLMSMFGFIIVVGMIVDDSIVVAENIYRKIESGMSRIDAAIEGTKEVIIPVLISILTTIAAFIPLLLISGIIGKFFGVIPIIVSLTLIVSFLECMLVLPAHLMHAKKLKNMSKKTLIFNEIMEKYRQLIRFILNHRIKALLIVVGASILILALIIPNIPFEFFPGRIDEMECIMETENSFSLKMTEEAVILIEEKIQSIDPDSIIIQDIISIVGAGSNQQNSSIGDTKAYIRIIFNPKRPGNFKDQLFKEKLEKIPGDVKGIKSFEVRAIQTGPPRGKAVNIIAVGEDFDKTKKAADDIKKYAESLKNTQDVKLDYEAGKSELVIDVNDLKAAAHNLTPVEIALSVKQAFDGGIAATLKEKGEDIDIRVKYDTVSSATISTLDKKRVRNKFGQNIKFSELAEINIEEGISEVRHYNGKLAISVLGNIRNRLDNKNTSTKINSLIRKKFGKTNIKYPDVRFIYGGENEDVQKTLKDLAIAYIFAFVIILILLIGLFKKFSQVFLIVIIIPFSLVGVFIGLIINRISISYTVMIGIIALSGVVVNDAIILIDFINKKSLETKNLIDAVVDASALRLRPILITTITTVVGLIPLAYGLGGREEFLQPMGIALVYGLFFATFITLILIPVLYLITQKSNLRCKK